VGLVPDGSADRGRDDGDGPRQRPPGDNLIELVRMADAGLGNAEAVRAATADGATALGLDDVGVVREGAVADLLVVDGDPLVGIAVPAERERIWLVLVAGRPVAGQALAPQPL
jgi:imidazolonepropionase-like amidohydrolase